MRTGGSKVFDLPLFGFGSVRDGQIFRWPFQKARWIAARAEKDACDREHDLAAQAPCNIIEDYSAQRDFQEAANFALFSSARERKQLHANEQDLAGPECLLQLEHTLSRSGTAIALSGSDPAHPPTLPWSDILDGCNADPPSSVSYGCYYRCAAVDSRAPTHEFNEHPQHSFVRARDKFSDGQLLEHMSEARSSSYLGAVKDISMQDT